MNEKEKKQIMEYIKENEGDLYIYYSISEEELNDIEDKDDLANYLENINEDGCITDEDVIYYSEAIKYLAENDSSLCYSLEMAKDYGYSINDINSELLASLLKTSENEEKYCDFIKDICDFYDEIKEV